MNKDLLISVIIPVYNGAKTLSRVVESVLCQMNGQVELILVDDGSTDSSGVICDEYAKAYENIHVIHKENGGTSSAKNMGIRAAKGKYLSLMDCDDYIDRDAYEQIISVLQEFQPDCLDFGLKYIGQSGDVTYNHHKIEKDILHKRDVIEEKILPPLLNLCKDEEHFIFDFAVTKIYKAEIIQTNGILFDEDKRTWEDRTFTLRHLKYCENFYSMKQCFYNYVYTPNSLSQRYTPEYFRIIVENFCHYRELYEDKFDFDTEYVNEYWANAIWNMILISMGQKENKDLIYQKIQECLTDEQVIHWFSKRPSKDATEKKISTYVVSGDNNKLIKLAEKISKKKEQKQKRDRVLFSIKYRFKQALHKKQV